MRRGLGICLLVVIAAGCPGSASTQIAESPAWTVVSPSEYSLEELLARHLEALGGFENLANLRSVRKAGKITAPGLSGAPMTTAIRRPDRYLRKLELGPRGHTVAFDGKTAWEWNPLADIDEPTPLKKKELPSFRRDADLTGPLVDPQAKGHHIELLGKTQAGYKLEAVFDGGDERSYLLDPETFLIASYLEVRHLRGGLTAETIGSYRDYREVAGVMWAYLESVSFPARRYRQSITWETIEVNVDLPDAEFEMPVD